MERRPCRALLKRAVSEALRFRPLIPCLDACNLHELPNQAFDLTISIFGAMFAPKPFDVAKEAIRVTRRRPLFVASPNLSQRATRTENDSPLMVTRMLAIGSVLVAALAISGPCR
jgi:hypothetical protein